MAVDLGDGPQMGVAPGEETLDSCPDVSVGSREANPVFEAVGGLGGRGAVVKQEQAGHLPFDQPGTLFRFSGPSHQHDVHEG